MNIYSTPALRQALLLYWESSRAQWHGPCIHQTVRSEGLPSTARKQVTKPDTYISLGDYKYTHTLSSEEGKIYVDTITVIGIFFFSKALTCL